MSEPDIIAVGGYLMWPIILLAVLGLVFFVERFLYLHRRQIKPDEFLEGIKNLLSKHRLIEALTVCEETSGPVARVAKAALLQHDKSYDHMLNAARTAAVLEIPMLERRIGTILAIAKIAPLLGLLGTLVALMQGMQLMGVENAYANASVFSTLVAKALITSVAGLLVSILAHLSYHFLHGRIRAIAHDIEWVGNQVIDFVIHELPELEESDE